MHSKGFVHLDIKPDNIMIASSNLESAESSLLTLIDFSITQFVNNDDLNNKEDKFLFSSDVFEFNGNLAFSSKDQMYGKGKTSFLLTI